MRNESLSVMKNRHVMARYFLVSRKIMVCPVMDSAHFPEAFHALYVQFYVPVVFVVESFLLVVQFPEPEIFRPDAHGFDVKFLDHCHVIHVEFWELLRYVIARYFVDYAGLPR